MPYAVRNVQNYATKSTVLCCVGSMPQHNTVEVDDDGDPGGDTRIPSSSSYALMGDKLFYAQFFLLSPLTIPIVKDSLVCVCVGCTVPHNS